jgi:hypothetical protein
MAEIVIAPDRGVNSELTTGQRNRLMKSVFQLTIRLVYMPITVCDLENTVIQRR